MMNATTVSTCIDLNDRAINRLSAAAGCHDYAGAIKDLSAALNGTRQINNRKQQQQQREGQPLSPRDANKDENATSDGQFRGNGAPANSNSNNAPSEQQEQQHEDACAHTTIATTATTHQCHLQVNLVSVPRLCSSATQHDDEEHGHVVVGASSPSPSSSSQGSLLMLSVTAVSVKNGRYSCCCDDNDDDSLLLLEDSTARHIMHMLSLVLIYNLAAVSHARSILLNERMVAMSSAAAGRTTTTTPSSAAPDEQAESMQNIRRAVLNATRKATVLYQKALQLAVAGTSADDDDATGEEDPSCDNKNMIAAKENNKAIFPILEVLIHMKMAHIYHHILRNEYHWMRCMQQSNTSFMALCKALGWTTNVSLLDEDEEVEAALHESDGTMNDVAHHFQQLQLPEEQQQPSTHLHAMLRTISPTNASQVIRLFRSVYSTLLMQGGEEHNTHGSADTTTGRAATAATTTGARTADLHHAAPAA
mmetsp:Transcript_17103/g.48069  ORF Transcript_17103/g.48069 Transcript_17103/m.48069 type:complete len:478 (+) Transcript_17103:99-1532(+)